MNKLTTRDKFKKLVDKMTDCLCLDTPEAHTCEYCTYVISNLLDPINAFYHKTFDKEN